MHRMMPTRAERKPRAGFRGLGVMLKEQGLVPGNIFQLSPGTLPK